MDIRPIRTEADYEQVLAEIESLFDAKAGTPEADRLDVLATLVSAYEDVHYPIEHPDLDATNQYFLESRNMTSKDLVPYFGSELRVQEVLDRQRPLSLDMIRHIHEQLGISEDILIQPYRTVDAAA